MDEQREDLVETLLKSNGPITLSLPPFRGVTRRIVLLSLVVFLVFWVLGIFLPDLAFLLGRFTALEPRLAAHGMIWMLVTYPFSPLQTNMVSEAFALLSLWFFGSTLEDEHGGRWLGEYFVLSAAGGALLATLLSYAMASRMVALDPSQRTSGLWPAVLALLLAFARFHGNETLRIYFVIPIKAKFLAALYLLGYLVIALVGGDKFGAMTALCVALSGYLYLLFAPRRGVGFVGSERWFSLRNAYYRAKRKQAAKKFAVYMKKQGKETNIDTSGRYVDPNGVPRDPDDKRWMN